jgi:hypothetical protein
METRGTARGFYNTNAMKETFRVNLQPDDVKYLDSQLLDRETGRIKLLPASVYKDIDPIHLAVWGSLKARYSFPTKELIDWLRGVIAGRTAIEIGAGNGDLGYHVGIRMTDNYSQQFPEVKLWYALQSVVPTEPPSDVEKLDAIAAVKKYQPQVVVGSFITEKWYKGGATGNMFGPEEEDILAGTDCYIHIGNEVTHATKRIRKYPHETLKFDWLITKSMYPDQNVIYVWNR